MTNSLSKIKNEKSWKPTFINNVEQEEWRCIHIDNKTISYDVSSFGRIKNSKYDKMMKLFLNNGYYYIIINKKHYGVNRLVANEFLLTNGDKKTLIVNHLDGNKRNNKVSNLEYCTHQNNIIHAYENNLINSYNIKVNQFNLEGVFLRSYKSIIDASTITKILETCISGACKKKQKTAGGFIWKYDDESKNLVEIPKKSRPIIGYDNYSVTRDGRIFTKNRNNYLKPTLDDSGYQHVTLTNKKGRKTFLVHRLVADAYIPNNDPLKNQVNHKNMIKNDNNVKNLEWMTASENIKHSYENPKRKTFGIKVTQYDLNHKIIRSFNSIKEAAHITKIGETSISLCCNNLANRAGQFTWRFFGDEFIEKEIKKISYGYKISKFDLEDNLIKTYNSMSEANLDTKIAASSITNACIGKLKTAGGYKWKRENGDDSDDFKKKKKANIDGFDNYKVTEDGKIFNIKKNIYMNSKITESGILSISLTKNRKQQSFLVYKLVTDAFNLNPKNKKNVKFINKDRTDNNIKNISWY